MVKGDVNGDGIADVSDIVLFQKWLLGDPDAVLSNWKAADLYADGQLDAMDLLLLKQTLVRQEQMDTTPALLRAGLDRRKHRPSDYPGRFPLFSGCGNRCHRRSGRRLYRIAPLQRHPGLVRLRRKRFAGNRRLCKVC